MWYNNKNPHTGTVRGGPLPPHSIPGEMTERVPLMKKTAKKLSLTWQSTIGLVLGILLGLLLQNHASVAETYIKPIGTVYLNLIKMVVVPVVLLSIMQGIISLQDIRRVGSIGVKTVVYYTLTTALAVTVGLPTC